MNEERKRILKLVEDGTISAEEAIVLLEALNKEKESHTSAVSPTPKEGEHQQSTEQKEETSYSSEEEKSKSTGFEDLFGGVFNKDTNKKMDEFMNDLKQDLSQFSGRVMNLMNQTFSKIKDLDIEFPFGEKVEYNKAFTYNANEIKGIELNIPNGKLEIDKVEDDQLLVEATIKTVKPDQDPEKFKTQFEQQFVQLNDGLLSLSVESKMTQVMVRIKVPEKQYDMFILRLLNGSVAVNNVNSKLLKVKTYNGTVRLDQSTFQSAHIETGNGAVEVVRVQGEDLEVETVNGRIYIDGDLENVEAESVNGAVIVTTHSKKARKLKAKAVAGAVELYVPKTVSLDGRVTTNLGKTDVGLTDIVRHSDDDQFLQKTVHFDKIIENASLLKIYGESRTGSVIVRYTTH